MEMRRRGDGKIQKRSSIRRSGKLTNKGGGVWKQNGQNLRKALLEQLSRYVAEHKESQYKDEGRKNSGGGTGKLNKQYTKRRRH